MNHFQIQISAILPNKIEVKVPSDPSSTQIALNSLLVFVCQPHLQGKKAIVNPTYPIYIINPIFPGMKKVYFHNGHIINPNDTFLDCEIANGDRILTVPVEEMSPNAEIFWKKATSNSSKGNQKTFSHDSKMRQIVSKFLDLPILKEESGNQNTDDCILSRTLPRFRISEGLLDQ